MRIINTSFEGLFILETNNFQDERGCFQKLFNYDFFEKNGLATDFKEFYYSLNKKGVRRGMHFQSPPYDHVKVVYVSKGRIMDVVVDIRKYSKTYGMCFSLELDDQKAQYLYIPKGFAHGFLSLEDNTIVNYAQTSCYNKDCDCGIDQNSIDFDWGIDNPIVSGRDLTFPALSDFNTPFKRMNILITGATGFIGTNLTRELRKEHNLFILGQFEGDPEKLGLPGCVMTDDIYQLASFIKENRIDGIIHLASLYLTVHSSGQVKDLVSSNVYFGTAVLEAASLAGCVKWFLNTGSIWQNYNTKGMEYNPVNLYAATKQAFIDMAKYYTDVFGIKFCTLKLCDTYGPNDTRRKIFKLFKDYSESGELLKMSPGEQLIDLLYITDIIAGFKKLAELLASNSELGDEYVLTSGKQIPLKDLAQLFSKVSGRKLNIEWGGRPYREREVMIPWKGVPVPEWRAMIGVEDGIRLFLGMSEEI